MKRILLFFVAMTAFATMAGAQGWFRQPTPNDTLRSVVVLPDNSVVFQIFVDFVNDIKYLNVHYSTSLYHLTNGLVVTYENGTLTVDLSDVPNQTNQDTYLAFTSRSDKYRCYIYGV